MASKVPFWLSPTKGKDPVSRACMTIPALHTSHFVSYFLLGISSASLFVYAPLLPTTSGAMYRGDPQSEIHKLDTYKSMLEYKTTRRKKLKTSEKTKEIRETLRNSVILKSRLMKNRVQSMEMQNEKLRYEMRNAEITQHRIMYIFFFELR